MKLIKAAITYKATIPTDVDALIAHLEEKQFTECGELQLRSTGFVPVIEGGALVERFAGGLAFRVRIDDKIIPSAAVKAEVEKRAKAIEAQTGRKPGRKERAEIKEVVLLDLARRALVKTTASVTCFYEVATGYLIVATSSGKVSDHCVSLLISAVGSVKTETLHVSDAKHGLTTRLKEWLADDEGFGDFQPCDEVALVNEGRKVSVKMSSLQQAHSGLTEALLSGFSVKSIGFHHGSVDFRLTDDFQLKRIHFVTEDLQHEDDNWWSGEAAVSVKAVSDIISQLVEMLSYKAEQDDEQTQSATNESI